MELVANLWPVTDQQTGLVQRFFMRAYALEADDTTISQTLGALAPTDFLMARVFTVPKRFQFVSSHGTQEGCIPLSGFHQDTFKIIEHAFQALEQDYSRLQGIAIPADRPVSVVTIPRFASDPYLVVTVLLETPDGQLVPQLKKSSNIRL